MATGNKGGRPRLADAEKAKKGTLQKCRATNKPAAAPPALTIQGPPPPPEWLGEFGRKEWLEKTDMLDRLKILHKTDLGLLAMLCREWENYIDAEKKAKEVNRYYETEKGYIGIHPLHTIAQQHLKAYIQLCNEFGFSPASRSRISMPADEKIVSKAALLLKKAV